MSSDAPGGDDLGLNEAERARIRAEIRYAMVAARELRESDPKPASGWLTRVLGHLSNGFVLLLVGSLITSWLVPQFQRTYDARKQRIVLMQDCLGQFLLYGNTLWQEYYAILPLTQQVEIDQATYLTYLGKIADIKLKRYDSYAKVRALAVVFEAGSAGALPIVAALEQYAIDLNAASAMIDKWLRDLYCTPTQRAESPCSSFDPGFDAFSDYTRIKQVVVATGNTGTDSVSNMIVRRIAQE